MQGARAGVWLLVCVSVGLHQMQPAKAALGMCDMKVDAFRGGDGVVEMGRIMHFLGTHRPEPPPHTHNTRATNTNTDTDAHTGVTFLPGHLPGTQQ